MSNAGLVQHAAALLRGRWQIPLAAVATFVAGTTLYRLIPTTPSTPAIDLDSLLADVQALEDAGATTAAADALANLLEMRPPFPPEQQALLHDRLADVIYRQELRRDAPNLNNVRLLLEHHDEAVELGQPQSAERLIRVARAAEWLGDSARAVPALRGIATGAQTPAQHRAARQALVRLLGNDAESRAERCSLLEELMTDEGASVSYIWWALQESVQEALDENDPARARRLVTQYGERLRSSDLKGYEQYLWAWVLVREGRVGEAEPLVRWIDEWLETPSPARGELNDFGYLPAMNRWLLGQIHLAEHRPQAALAAFEDATAYQPFGELFIAALAGRASALVELGRYDAARRFLHDAVERLGALSGQRQHEAERLARHLFEQYGRLVKGGAYVHVPDYFVMSPAELTKERLALVEALEQAGEETAGARADAERLRRSHGQAGRALEQAAELTRADEARHASFLWSAAHEYDEAGQFLDARRALQRFLEGRSEDPRLPRALLQLGQTFEQDGQLQEALRWYGRVITEYPTLEEAFRAELLRAGCWTVLGRVDDAEAALRELLADDNFTPQAAVFREALLELCDLLYEQGHYGEAIGRLENFTALYPEDPGRYRAGFLLADAYWRSAESLRDRPPAHVDAEAVQATRRERLRQAAELFADLLRTLAAESEPDDALALYERLALLYRADCLFELNEPDTLQEALKTYRRAAARYEREPAALTAQVQIANIYLRLGQVSEAARAVKRACQLLPNIPEAAFTAYGDGTDRECWNRYLTAISSLDLFGGALVGAH